MTNDKKERYAKVMQHFINEVENAIEDKIPEWLNDNPYWEIDDEDENGHRIFRCPPTRSKDAREALSEEFVSSGEDVEHKSCVYFFEFIINELYGFPMSKKNPYREQPVEETKGDVLPLTPTEKAIAAINKGTANFINEICGVSK